VGVSVISLVLLLSAASDQLAVVECTGDRVTVRAVNAPLRNLVEEVAARTGIVLTGVEELTGAESIDIRNEYLEAALKALLEHVNYVVTREEGILHLRIHSMVHEPPAPVEPISIAGLTDVIVGGPRTAPQLDVRAQPKDPDDEDKEEEESEENEELANLERATQSIDDDATLQISASLTSDHVNVRIRALHLLAARAVDPDALAEIASAFSDENSEVVLTASNLLASIPGSAAQEAIESLLLPDSAPELHYAALRSLALRGDPSSITAVRRAAEQGPAEVREYAGQLLTALEQRLKALVPRKSPD
jgi:hypothetical protein